MVLSLSDCRLGAIEHDVLPLQGAGAGAASERNGDLHVVRDADPGPAAVVDPSPIEPAWYRNWKRSLSMQRALRERQYCEQIRDAKAEGRTPLSADEFFSQ